jgi:cullin-associated NEDD8-dissociated protein 1
MRLRSASADVALSPRARLAQLVPSIAKALSREMLSKSMATRFASYTVLRELVLVLHGGLDAHIGLLVGPTDKALRGVDAGASASGANLRGEVLLFLRVLFQFHAPQAFEAHLAQLVAVIVAAIDDKLHRDAVEAFAVCSQLVAVLRPLSGSGSPAGSAYKAHVEHIYRAVLARLRRPDSDQEIKDRGIATLGVLLAHAGDDLAAHFDECLPELLERLRNEVTRFATVKVVGRVAASRVCQGAAFEAFVRDCIAEVSTLLRKSSRPLKLAAFETLDALLRRAGGSGLDDALCAQIFAEIEPLMGAEGDVNLLPMALHAVSLLLELHTATAAPTTQSRLVPHLLLLLHSPLMQGAALDAVTMLFKTLARVQSAAAPGCIEALMSTLKAASGKGSATPASAQTHATVARCIGAVLVSTPQQAEAVVTGALRTLERGEAKSSEVHIYFNLLLLGEIGRFADLAARSGVLDGVVAFYAADSEQIRSAAAFALGNMAVGSLAVVLPLLEQHIATDDAKRRLLSLHALKELISHASPAALASIAQRLWTPLFEHCETAEEATRTIGAECLARLTLNDPKTYLPQLKTRLHSPSAATRAAVISAVRFTLTESRASYDELLAPEMLDFLSLLQDAALEVRRHAVFALNAAAHNKPHLISDQLVILLPLLYQETHPRPELLRKVTMGPFTVTSDDGLDLRKVRGARVGAGCPCRC